MIHTIAQMPYLQLPSNKLIPLTNHFHQLLLLSVLCYLYPLKWLSSQLIAINAIEETYY